MGEDVQKLIQLILDYKYVLFLNLFTEKERLSENFRRWQ